MAVGPSEEFGDAEENRNADGFGYPELLVGPRRFSRKPYQRLALAQPLSVIVHPCVVGLRGNGMPEARQVRHEWNVPSRHHPVRREDGLTDVQDGVSLAVWAGDVDAH